MKGEKEKKEAPMAQIPVEFLLKSLEALLTNEARLLRDVRPEVESIRLELQSMRSFLKDADSRKNGDRGTESVETWVKDVREAAYDVEDIVDEFMLRFGRPFDGGFLGYLQKVSRSIKHISKRHDLARRIQGMKGKIHSISERRHRYHLNVEGGASSSTDENERLRALNEEHFAEDADVVGMDSDIETLTSWLVEGDTKLTTILLVGMGGLGKTSLAKKVYNSAEVHAHFECLAWVSVSQSFHPEMVLQGLLRGSYKSRSDTVPYRLTKEKDVKALGEALKEYVQDKRYVFVLDDVWSVEVLNTISFAFPNGSCQGRIIVTSRSEDVASGIENKTEKSAKILRLHLLSPETSINLFCRKAFRDDPQRACPPHLQEICVELVEKCGNLPLAIVTLGGIMSNKEQLQDWVGFHNRLSSEISGNPNLARVRSILSLSYNELPVHLKACLLYCGIFPKNYLIKVNRLIRLWVNDGLVEQTQDMTFEEVGKQYLRELMDRSLLQVAERNIKGSVKLCRIHHLLRDLVVSMSVKQGFSKIIPENNGSNGCPIANERRRRLSLHGTSDYALSVHEASNMQCVRSLFMFGADFMPEVLKNFVLMRVLDLQGIPIGELPDAIGHLFHLRYLNLRRTNLKKLPSSFKKLHNLQVLDIRDNQIERLPNISKMKGLRYVSASSRTNHTKSQVIGCEFPSEICTFGNLQKLSGVNATNKIVEIIGNLTQLKNLGIFKVKEDHERKLCASISKMKNLVTLGISSVNDDGPLKLEWLTPPPCLEDIWLFGHLEKLPSWMSCLEILMRLGLYFSKLGENPFFSLQSLPNLLWLKLYDAYDGKELRCYANSFRNLKTLTVKNLANLRSIIVEEGALPSIQTLSICECPKLRRVQEVDCLPTLQLLYLRDVPREVLDNIHNGPRRDRLSTTIQYSCKAEEGSTYKHEH